MVFALFMSLMDVLAGGVMLATHFGILHNWRFAFMGAAYLIGKGWVFRGSFLSALDIMAGLYLLLTMFGLKTFLAYVFFGVMIYKFVVSLMMRG